MHKITPTPYPRYSETTKNKGEPALITGFYFGTYVSVLGALSRVLPRSFTASSRFGCESGVTQRVRGWSRLQLPLPFRWALRATRTTALNPTHSLIDKRPFSPRPLLLIDAGPSYAGRVSVRASESAPTASLELSKSSSPPVISPFYRSHHILIRSTIFWATFISDISVISSARPFLFRPFFRIETHT